MARKTQSPKRKPRPRRERGSSLPAQIATRLLTKERERSDMAALSHGAALAASRGVDPGLDLDKPWWLFYAPSRLTRPGFELLMGLAPKGAAAPDWPALFDRATELSRKAHPHEPLHRFPPLKGLMDISRWQGALDGRVGVCEFHWQVASHVGAGRRSGFWSPLARQKGKTIDPRRVRRRAGQNPPAPWTERFGSQAARMLWELGASSSILTGSLPLCSQSSPLEHLREAMLEFGAEVAILLPGFSEAFPTVGYTQGGVVLREIETQVLDPIRAGWILRGQALPASKNRAPSL